MKRQYLVCGVALAALMMAGAGIGAVTARAQGGDAGTSPMAPDIPASFQKTIPDADYIKREVMIPMRDGTKLHTVIVIPRGAHDAPIMLTRTPYNASHRAERALSPNEVATLAQGDEVFIPRGYIRVFQDIRGKYGSEGDYVMTRPLHGPLNPTKVDHSTDAYDTIDWLVKNLPESNGRVGMIGSSYEGFTVLMALINPHPALKAAVPMSPMVDGWKGDDWFHNGAFRQTNFDYIIHQTAARGEGGDIARGAYDDYETFRRAGSAGGFAHLYGFDQLPYWRKLSEHPAYDGYWQAQALDTILATRPISVPTMIVGALWDQEDIYGAIHTYAATKPNDSQGNVHLVLGPWRHSGVNYDGGGLGALKFPGGDTALAFRRDIMVPFLDANLRTPASAPGTPAAKAEIPTALVYETGTDVWRHLDHWPLSCAEGCGATSQPLYLQAGFGLGFSPATPPQGDAGYDEYVSDPAKPVPYVPRPVRFKDGDAWKRWLVSDQRAVADRTDVLTYETPVLKEPVKIAGTPIANLYAATSGTDSDWVVKLIDVYPDEVPSQPELGGYQLGIAMDIFRGRYRDSLEHPTAIPAGEVQRYRFALPPANHVFLPGHRIMVQIQSSWFPLYDRNPQTFVPNIFFAQPGDYHAATQRVYHQGASASMIELPVVPTQP